MFSPFTQFPLFVMLTLQSFGQSFSTISSKSVVPAVFESCLQSEVFSCTSLIQEDLKARIDCSAKSVAPDTFA